MTSADHALDTALGADDDPRAPEVQPRLRDQILWGAAHTLPANLAGPSGVTWKTFVLVPAADEARDFEVTFQPDNLQQITSGQLFVRVTYTQGEVTYVKQFALAQPSLPLPVAGPVTQAGGSDSVVPFRGHVAGRRVQIDMAWCNASAADVTAKAAVRYQVGAAEGGWTDSPLDFYFPQRVTQNVANADHGQLALAAGPGILLSAQSFVTAMPAAPGNTAVCVMFFDSAQTARPANGAQPILCSPPIVAAFGGQNFDGGLSPTVRYKFGLLWALSSTFDTFTACGAGGSARVDCQLGA